MSLDPRIQAFFEQTGLLVKPGSPPREPMLLLAELRANDERAKLIMAQGLGFKEDVHSNTHQPKNCQVYERQA